MKRKLIVIADDDLSKSQLIDILRHKCGFSKNTDIIVLSLIELTKSVNLTNPEKDFIAEQSRRLHKAKNRKTTYSMYEPREAILKILEMVIKGLDYKAIDEKRRSLLGQLKFNRHNPEQQKFLKNMTHKVYDEIRLKSSYGLAQGRSISQLKMLGYDGIMQLDKHDKAEVINITPKKNRRHR